MSSLPTSSGHLYRDPAACADDDADSALECAVCLQTCVHPVQLPCRHIFCFLCVKGVSIQSKRCPMCRREIPATYLDNPNLIRPIVDSKKEEVEQVEEEGEEKDDDDEYRWFYEGHNGWWMYDERTCKDLETHHKRGDKVCELLIAGYLYVVDLEHKLQCRRNEPNRRRRIKRDLATVPKKGIAGIRVARPEVQLPQVASSPPPRLPSSQQQQGGEEDASVESLGEIMARGLLLSDSREEEEESNAEGGGNHQERADDDYGPPPQQRDGGQVRRRRTRNHGGTTTPRRQSQ